MRFKPVIPRQLANRDVDEVIAWYLSEGTEQPASVFVYALEQAYPHIGGCPATGSTRYADEPDIPGLRSWPPKRFPHLVFCIERDDHVDVWRRLHGQRDIPAWMLETD
ncbi:MAG: type II toxin-antitoxin system RelE/ParE family toxin [Dechloromonas sp.]|nr:type II toxin-antitoxin system RelE/ParE family toxin [Dechloromonas sp.]